MKRKRRKTRKDKIQFTDEQIVQIETMAGYGLTQLQICHILEVSPDTMQRRVREGDTRITAAIGRGQSKGNLMIAQKAYNIAMEGNAGMIKYILSCRAGWSDKPQINEPDEDELALYEEEFRQRIREEESEQAKKFIEVMTDEEMDEYKDLLTKEKALRKKVEGRLEECPEKK